MDLHSAALVFIPVNDCTNIDSGGGSHWSLIVFSRIYSKFMYFDSAGRYNLLAAQNTVQKISKVLMPKTVDGDEVDMEVISTPQQKNGSDCGVFTCAIAEYLSATKGNPTNLKQDINQSYVSTFRSHIYSLLKKYNDE
jgi:sentrin-specific protease 8